MTEHVMLSDRVSFEDVPELSDLLLKLGKVRLHIASGSMAPALKPGDEIAVEPVSTEALEPGDLLLFRQNGRLICHRLVEISPGLLRTRGDATGGLGEHIASDQVLGKVVNLRRRTPWVGLKIDVKRALAPPLIRGLACLQKLKPYRWLMQPLAAPLLSYHLGVSQGAYRHKWQRVDSPAELPRLEPATRAHVLMVRCGASVAGWASLVFHNSAWQCENITVRIRYRGLGIESGLAHWAHLLFNAQRCAET